VSLFRKFYNYLYPPPPEPELPEALKRPQATRADGWMNPWTGVGTNRDKSIAGYFTPKFQLPPNELIAMFNSSDLARKIVVKPVKEMFRRGYKLETAEGDQDPDETKALEKKLSDLLLVRRLMWGKIWGRLFGGAITIMGAMDGRTPDQPLDEDNISSFEFLNTVDRRYVWVQRYYSDPLSPKYGMPELYLVTNMVQGSGLSVAGVPTAATNSTTVVHETRVIRWDGNETDDITKQQLAGWTFSILQTVYDVMRQFEHSFGASQALLSDASQAVFKLKGLIDSITSGDKNAVQQRLAMVDMGRSTIKAVLLDAEEEEFKREPTSFGGIADLLRVMMSRLCACTDMPHSELFGEAPGGLNDNAEGETRKWYDLIDADRETDLKPLMERVINLVSKASDSPVTDKTTEWKVTFRPLYAPTDKEDAEYRLAVAQADAIYLTNGVVTPEQVALGRWGSGKFSPNIQVDADELQEAIEGKVMADPYENEPDPTDPSLKGGGTGTSPNSPTPTPIGAPPAGSGTAAAGAGVKGRPMKPGPAKPKPR